MSAGHAQFRCSLGAVQLSGSCTLVQFRCRSGAVQVQFSCIDAVGRFGLIWKELPASDQEQPEDAKTLDTTEEAGPDTSAVETSIDKKYPVDLWLVAKCWDHHASVVREVFRGEQCRWMAVSTRTAHPSIFVGVQSVVGTVIGMVRGPVEHLAGKAKQRETSVNQKLFTGMHAKLRHSMAHGRVLLDDMCTALKLDEASRSLNLKRKMTDVACVPVFNPSAADGSVFKLLEIPVESSWRNGVLT